MSVGRLPELAELLDATAAAEPADRVWLFELAHEARLRWVEAKRKERQATVSRQLKASTQQALRLRLDKVLTLHPERADFRVYTWRETRIITGEFWLTPVFCAAYPARDELYNRLKPYTRRHMKRRVWRWPGPGGGRRGARELRAGVIYIR